MIDKITPITQFQRVAEVQKAQHLRQGTPAVVSTDNTQSGRFGEILRQEFSKTNEPRHTIAFSKHAMARAAERGIEVTPDLMNQLADSVERAQAKGATNILAFDANRAFIINVPHGRVITTMSQVEMKENIFTNIDGAVIL